MMKSRAILPVLALVLCIGVFLFPMTALAQISDTTPPTVTAGLSGDTLTIQATDDVGVEAIFVGAYRFSTLVNGTANVRLRDYAGTEKQVVVYATDAAGNRSQPVLIDNPYYVEPVAQPSAGAVSPVEAPPLPSLVTSPALPEPKTPTNPPNIEDSNTAGTSQTAVATGPNAFTPDGAGTVLDNATEEEGKEFFTVTATDGSVYYLVIDRQRGTENVYFLSAVTRNDLTSLTEDSAPTGVSIATPEPQPQESESPEEEQEQPEQPAQSEDNMGTMIFILLVVAVIGGVAYYVKIVKPRRQARDEEEYEDDSDDEDGGEYLFEGDPVEYYPDGADAQESFDNEQTARYNDTADEKTD